MSLVDLRLLLLDLGPPPCIVSLLLRDFFAQILNLRKLFNQVLLEIALNSLCKVSRVLLTLVNRLIDECRQLLVVNRSVAQVTWTLAFLKRFRVLMQVLGLVSCFSLSFLNVLLL